MTRAPAPSPPSCTFHHHPVPQPHVAGAKLGRNPAAAAGIPSMSPRAHSSSLRPRLPPFSLSRVFDIPRSSAAHRDERAHIDTMAATTTTTTTIAAHDHAMPDDPFTPSKPSHSSNARLQDSPFSDYFTDDGRSPNGIGAPSPEKRQLLVRLNSLQAQLIHGERESEQQTLNIVERKVNEIETQLNALHSQTRMPPEMEDSGLFMEDDDDEDENESTDGTEYREPSPNGSMVTLRYPASPEQKQAENDFVLLESQRLLESVTKANEQLRLRLEETKSLHDRHAVQLQARDQEIASLRVENEALRTDLGHDQSELLYLKVQYKSLQAETEALESGAQRLERYAPEMRDDIQRVKRQRVAARMSQWRSEWEGVEGRMRERMQAHAIDVCEDAADIGGGDDNDDALEGQTDSGAWRLDTVDQDDTTLSRQYTSTSTQTERPPAPSIQADEESPDVEEESSHIDDTASDCAITTSSEDKQSTFSDDDDNDDDGRGRRRYMHDGSLRTSPKTAWQELWEGLSGLAGMGDDRF